MTRFPLFSRGILIAAFLLAGVLSTYAQSTLPATNVPHTISYQGLLSSTDGTPFINGEHRVTVALYADEHGTRPIWADTYTAQVTGGVFNLYLGSAKPLPAPSTIDGPLWIGTTVDGGDEMRPLTPLAASPYALNVSDGAVTTDKIADGAVTAEKVDMNYISELHIDGHKVSSKGTVLNLVSTPSVPLKYDETTGNVTIGRAATQSGVDEKGTTVLANQDQVWSANGDAWDIGGGVVYTPASGDWIGTSNSVAFELRTFGTPAMRYHTPGSGQDPNVEAGSSTIAAAVGSTIAGGGSNAITGDYNTVSGGQANTVYDGNYNAIGGGHDNGIAVAGSIVQSATISGGGNNYVDATSGTIGGGEGNQISTGCDNGLISGGKNNHINGPSRSASLSGGENNGIDGSENATLGGGLNNGIHFSNAAMLAGGQDNQILSSEASVISGGVGNEIHAPYATVAGGFRNSVQVSGEYATISGGQDNTIDQNGEYSVIGGGYANTAYGPMTTIPGGDMLVAFDSYAQTVIGFNNNARGWMPFRPTAAQIAASNDPLFMIGNGSAPFGQTRSNAFEVSYNGHSVVFDVSGTGTVTPVIRGATYIDNIIYAWGHINANGTIGSDFGVANITHVAGSGVYDVTINIMNPDSFPITLTSASITVTGVESATSEGECILVTTTPIGSIGSNGFRIRTYDASGDGCELHDFPFMFKVTGRP